MPEELWLSWCGGMAWSLHLLSPFRQCQLPGYAQAELRTTDSEFCPEKISQVFYGHYRESLRDCQEVLSRCLWACPGKGPAGADGFGSVTIPIP